VYPALTVAGLLADGGRDEVLFVGTPNGLEARLVPEAGVPFYPIASAGFDRGNPLTLVTSIARVAVSIGRALGLMLRWRPDVVAGFGGYVSLPVGIAAVLTRTPLVLHEQNSVPGMANRFLSRWAQSVAVTYESSMKHLKRPERAVMTGNPVRAAVTTASREAGRQRIGASDGDVVVLVFGGSRGARHLNEALVRLWPTIAEREDVRVMHVAGATEVAAVRGAMAEALTAGGERYQLFEYLDDMGSAIAAADVVVSRAGATSIAEITAIGRASVLVPYPYATDDHQTLNARAVSVAGGAVVVPDAELDDSAFEAAVLSLVNDAGKRKATAAAAAALGRPDAGRRVADAIRGAGPDTTSGPAPASKGLST
jgi:UDP-N-acetylglucosamine--N-acetylmuramyl-(pentapeptide) pyrophosphoryl-undecaprenol N-acetylglucosamine transferase